MFLSTGVRLNTCYTALIIEGYFQSYRKCIFIMDEVGDAFIFGLLHLEHTLVEEVTAAGCPPDLTCQGIRQVPVNTAGKGACVSHGCSASVQRA